MLVGGGIHGVAAFGQPGEFRDARAARIRLRHDAARERITQHHGGIRDLRFTAGVERVIIRHRHAQVAATIRHGAGIDRES